MTSASETSNAVPHTRRAHDAGATRQALLDAASVLFDGQGYDATTVRQIGEQADVDPSLICRYFGSKEGLYLAALDHGDRPTLAPDLAEAVEQILTYGESRGASPVSLALFSPTLSDEVREQAQSLLGRQVLEPFTAELERRGVPDAALRAEVLLALVLGVSLTRERGTLRTLAATGVPGLLDVLLPMVAALQPPGGASSTSP
jgi:AcrR family transcriptional regulator